MSDAEDRASIEHELKILRARYALMQKWARITQWFFVIAAGVIAIVATIAFVAGDPATGGVCLIALCCTAFLILWNWGGRWIDTISPTPTVLRTWWTPTEAQAIETMIAERERRLQDIHPLV